MDNFHNGQKKKRGCHGPVVRAGLGRADNVEKLIGRAAAHEMWALYGLPRPVHEAAHVFSRAGPGRGR